MTDINGDGFAPAELTVKSRGNRIHLVISNDPVVDLEIDPEVAVRIGLVMMTKARQILNRAEPDDEV